MKIGTDNPSATYGDSSLYTREPIAKPTNSEFIAMIVENIRISNISSIDIYSLACKFVGKRIFDILIPIAFFRNLW